MVCVAPINFQNTSSFPLLCSHSTGSDVCNQAVDSFSFGFADHSSLQFNHQCWLHADLQIHAHTVHDLSKTVCVVVISHEIEFIISLYPYCM